MYYTKILTTAIFQRLATAFEVSFCTENTCGDCPVSLTSTGDGYPDCEVYDSESVFGNQGFDGISAGGWSAWMNVEEPNNECSILLLTPAHVDEEGCGALAGSFKHHTCAKVELDTSFMVQYCCGSDECEDAGGMKRDSQGGGTRLLSNGTVIEPIEVGSPKALRDLAHSETKSVAPRDDDGKITKCDGNWKGEEEGGYYTTNSDERKIVYADYAGGSVTITSERSQSYTSEMSAGISFEGILSLGASFSISETVSSSESVNFETADGQTGSVAFTPKLRCSKGKGSCDGEEVSGTICTGYRVDEEDKQSDVAGTYQVVLHD